MDEPSYDFLNNLYIWVDNYSNLIDESLSYPLTPCSLRDTNKKYEEKFALEKQQLKIGTEIQINTKKNMCPLWEWNQFHELDCLTKTYFLAKNIESILNTLPRDYNNHLLVEVETIGICKTPKYTHLRVISNPTHLEELSLWKNKQNYEILLTKINENIHNILVLHNIKIKYYEEPQKNELYEFLKLECSRNPIKKEEITHITLSVVTGDGGGWMPSYYNQRYPVLDYRYYFNVKQKSNKIKTTII